MLMCRFINRPFCCKRRLRWRESKASNGNGIGKSNGEGTHYERSDSDSQKQGGGCVGLKGHYSVRRVALAALGLLAHILQTSTDSSVILILTPFSCRRQGASADKLHVKAAKFLPLVGLARSKQDPINHKHGAQCFHRPPPAGKFSL